MLKQYNVTLLKLLKSWKSYKYIVSSSSPPANIPATHRLEHNWQYNDSVGFLKYRTHPEDALCKIETCWGLQFIYMIFNFLIILTTDPSGRAV